MRSFVLAACAMVLASCGDKEAGAPDKAANAAGSTAPAATAAPAADLSTPDRALKALWAVGDADRATRCDDLKTTAAAFPAGRKALDGIYLDTTQISNFTGSALQGLSRYKSAEEACRAQQIQLRREINDIKQETDSRAVANVTIYNTAPIPENADRSEWAMKWRNDGHRYRYVFSKIDDQWKIEEIYSQFDRESDYTPMFGEAKPSVPYVTSPF